ncbi:MAG TPA: hypothetical protein VE620_09685 [Myxococcales bacterium]|nr:hypothetical protein [Myxococcales bacterium]
MPLLFIALLAAAQVPPRDAVALTADGQVRDICSTLRGQNTEPAPGVTLTPSRAQALSRIYQLRVPSKGFAFGRYHEEEQELELDSSRPLRALDGALTLDLANADDVAFRATPAQMKEWAAAKRDNKLSLNLYFRPSGDDCAGNAAAKIFRMEGTPVWFEVENSSGVVAAADEEGLPVERPGSARTFRVSKVLLDSDAPRADLGKDRLSVAQPALDRCAEAARRRGSLVVSFSVQEGRVRNPQVIMDAARDEDTARCVTQALSGATIASVNPAATRGTASLAVQ